MSELCPLCQVVEPGPYCLAHGRVHRPFTIGGRHDIDELVVAHASWFALSGRTRAGRAVLVKLLRTPGSRSGRSSATIEIEQRFLRSAAALGALAHEHLVSVIDFGRDDALGVAYLVTDRPGQTAEALLQHAGPLAWQSAAPLLQQIARGIAAAHGARLSDGRLTLDRVQVIDGRRPTARLADFGLAGATIDPRADIYSLGAVGHELLTGRPPPEGRWVNDALSDDPVGMNEQDPALRLPARLDELIRACRLRNPMLRPSLDEIVATLGALDAAPATATAVPDPFEVPAMIGSYRVVSELGTGGTGRVFLGEHPLIGSKVAIKVLLPEIARSAETVERFIQEGRASSQIASPYLPRYFDFGTTAAGLPYAVMEYLEGETLGQRLTRDGTVTVAQAAQILEQVASALMMAHGAGLIHRDLKPDNIFLVNPERAGRPRLTADGTGASSPAFEVKVLDFGIAKMVGKSSATQTLTGAFLGTPFYCAPEQVFGHAVDARTDVYCLGCTAFHMLTGAPPFVGEVPLILSSKATEDPPDPRERGVLPVVADTIRRMLARDPAQRAPSMAWVLEEVTRWPRGDLDAGPTAPMPALPEAARHLAAQLTDRQTMPFDRPGGADDTATGARPDAGAEAVPGAMPDAVPDAAPDAAPDARQDAAAGVGPRAVSDAITSARADATVDSGPRAAQGITDHGPAIDGVPRGASTTPELRAVTAPIVGRRRTMLMIGAAALAATALIAVIRESLYGSTDPVSSTAPYVPSPVPEAQPAVTPAAPAPGSPGASPSASPPGAPPSAAPSGASPGGSPPGAPPPSPSSAPATSPFTAPRHVRGKPPEHEKRPPPPRKKPGEPKDVLIVDPFSNGN